MGTERVLSGSTFPEFQWGRKTFMVDWSRLPSGFEAFRGFLGADVAEVLQDTYVLQKYGETIGKPHHDLESIYFMDNQQACIESRIHHGLQASKENIVLTSILLAAYLYTYSLFVQIWNGSTIPLQMSTTLLSKLQQLSETDSWSSHEPVLLWCTVVGGCLSPVGATRSGYGILLRRKFFTSGKSPATSWLAMKQVLNSFLWSEKLFEAHGNSFWEENVLY
jgi:hypothetical protein